jgi:hypothetical protein
MPMSSADPLQTVAPVSRTPSGPVRLFKALYNPMYLAIVASVALHGLAVASLPVIGPMVSGGQQTPQGPRETKILKLTPAEAARLSSAFPPPKTTVLPPGLPSFNPNSNTATSFSPPPLSGDLSQSKSGQSWASIFGGNPSTESTESPQTSDGSSRVASSWYTGESDGASGESYDYSGESYAATGNSYSYPPSGVDFYRWVGSPPPANETATPDKTPAKPRIDHKVANNGRTPNPPAQNPGTANADGTRNNTNSPESNAIALGMIPGLRTGQSAIQDLEGNYPVLVVVKPDGSVGWGLLEDDKLAEGAIDYTFKKNPPSIPSEPGNYILTVTYAAPGSETTPDEIATVEPTAPEEMPTDNSELLALQEANPDYEMLESEPIEIFSEESAKAIVAFVVNAEGTETVELLQSTGNPQLDQRAIEEAYANREAASEQTIQTFEIQFNTPETSQPETEKPAPQPAPTLVTPNPKPKPTPESTSEPIPETEETIPESTSEPIPETEETIPESTSEPIPETEETMDVNPSKKPEESPENTEEESIEKIPIEPTPEVNPKKPRLDRQSALPSL